MEQDAARLYISQKTDIDRNFNTPGNSHGRSAVGLKADAVRLIGRESIMLVTRTEDTNSRGGSAGHGGISLVANNEASELQPMVKGHNLINALQEIDNRIKEVHTTLHNHIKDQKAFNEKVQSHTHEGTCPIGPVVTLVSTRASISFFGSSIMFGKAKTKAPRAPIAAASVGVAIPA